MIFIYVIIFLTLVAISAAFLLKNKYPHRISSKELLGSIAASLIVSGISIALTLGDIYSTIGSYYGAPSSTQLENIAMLRNTFNEGKAQFEKMKTSTIKAFEKELVKKSKTIPKILSFEEFLKSEN